MARMVLATAFLLLGVLCVLPEAINLPAAIIIVLMGCGADVTAAGCENLGLTLGILRAVGVFFILIALALFHQEHALDHGM